MFEHIAHEDHIVRVGRGVPVFERALCDVEAEFGAAHICAERREFDPTGIVAMCFGVVEKISHAAADLKKFSVRLEFLDRAQNRREFYRTFDRGSFVIGGGMRAEIRAIEEEILIAVHEAKISLRWPWVEKNK